MSKANKAHIFYRHGSWWYSYKGTATSYHSIEQMKYDKHAWANRIRTQGQC